MLNINRIEYESNTCHFTVDTVAELDLLPKINTRGQGVLNTIPCCSVGSTAVVTETSERYILNGEQNKWLKITSSGGGGGGGEDYDFADESDIDNLFKGTI